MRAQVWRTARWFVALGVCALVVVVAVPMTIDAITSSLVLGDAAQDDESADDDTDPAGSGEVPSGPVSDGEAAPIADFALRHGTAREGDSSALAITQDGDVAAAVFPLIDGDPSCARTVEVELHLQEGQPTAIGMYAATIHRPLDDGQEVDDPRLDDVVRALTVTDGTSGYMQWDVTDLYRAWATGELAPAGTPFAVVVAPAEDFAALTFSSAEADPDVAPALRWQGEPGCGEDVA